MKSPGESVAARALLQYGGGKSAQSRCQGKRMRKVQIDVSKLLGFKLRADVSTAKIGQGKIGRVKTQPRVDVAVMGAKIGLPKI